MGFFVSLILEHDNLLYEVVSSLQARDITTTYEADVTGGDEKGSASCLVLFMKEHSVIRN